MYNKIMTSWNIYFPYNKIQNTSAALLSHIYKTIVHNDNLRGAKKLILSYSRLLKPSIIYRNIKKNFKGRQIG